MSNLNSFLDKCKHCGSANLEETLELSGNIHHARSTCKDCGRWQKWLKKPSFPEVSISVLLQKAQIQSWEKKFLKSVVHSKNPTQSERIALEAISDRLNSL
ncbi:MAG: hypothetical protein KME38_25275 [Spirirestis rafaelensis WJT71-NPBG6]|jgi:hypothetical protein|nr:hypothetical protein [Spirirestis rafaelensis WJT71-NPBG6]